MKLYVCHARSSSALRLSRANVAGSGYRREEDVREPVFVPASAAGLRVRYSGAGFRSRNGTTERHTAQCTTLECWLVPRRHLHALLTAGAALLGFQQPVHGLDGDLQFGAAGLGGG